MHDGIGHMTPPWQGDPLARRPPGKETPWQGAPLARRPPWQGDPPLARRPPGKEPPPGKENPLARRPPPMVNQWAVRILLECILVLI